MTKQQKSQLTSALAYGSHIDMQIICGQPAECFACCGMHLRFPQSTFAPCTYSHYHFFPSARLSTHCIDVCTLASASKPCRLTFWRILKERHWPFVRNLHVKCWQGLTFLVPLAVFSHLWHTEGGDEVGKISTKSASHGSVPRTV